MLPCYLPLNNLVSALLFPLIALQELLPQPFRQQQSQHINQLEVESVNYNRSDTIAPLVNV